MSRTSLVFLLFAGCHGGAAPSPSTTVLMSFTRANGLYDAPFPSDDLVTADGHVDVSKFPNPNKVSLVDQALQLITNDAHGFAVSSGILIPLSAPLDPTHLPDLAGSLKSDASVFLMGVTPSAPDFLKRYPVQVVFMPDGGSLGAPNLLSILTLQGIPLRPKTSYVAVVLTGALDAKGQPLAVSPTVTELLAGVTPAGLSSAVAASYKNALAALPQANVATSAVAGLALFTTDDPTAELTRFRDAALTLPLPTPITPLKQSDLFPEFCVYESTIAMPDFQSGAPPFASSGGGWTYDASGNPLLQRMEPANLVVSIPRAPMPTAGYPMTVFVRAGGGGNRPLVDRGQMATNGGPPITPGTGPALYFARAGFAGLSVDGPLEGLRNTTNGNEDTLIFNFENAVALRDNIRETAMELSIIERVLEQLTFNASDCPGAGNNPVHFDPKHVALMGHSIGSTVAPLTLALEPRYGAAVLSGAGGSWIENIMYKQQPIDIRPLAEIILDYDMDQRDLTENDPAMILVQWAAEPADPPVYDRVIINEPPAGTSPRHVLMMQGIVDHYILPPIANTTTLSLGLDLAGPELDSQSAELTALMMTPLSAVIPYSGRADIPFPASGNRTINGMSVTAVLTQNPGDGIEDGHEVVFQTEPPKQEYRCFLSTWLTGIPKVPQGLATDGPCP